MAMEKQAHCLEEEEEEEVLLVFGVVWGVTEEHPNAIGGKGRGFIESDASLLYCRKREREAALWL